MLKQTNAMKAVTFFSRVQGNSIRCFGRPVWKGAWFLFAFCAIAAYAWGGEAPAGKVPAHKKWKGVTIGNSVYDARTRNFEKPWPFGAAPGPGGNSN